jgi:hypothetical protein
MLDNKNKKHGNARGGVYDGVRRFVLTPAVPKFGPFGIDSFT